MRQSGAALIAHYLDSCRLPVSVRWSRKHAHTQGRLCALYVAPVIAEVACQDIKTGHMQQVVNAKPTAGEGDRVQRMISALVTAMIDAGYLVNSRLAKVHWQAGERALPGPAVSVAGESSQWVDSAEIPSDGDIARLGRALAAGVHGDRDELMANAAYSGLRWGELIALTVSQVARQVATRSPSGSPCGLRKPAPSRRPGLTRSGYSSRHQRAGTGGHPIQPQRPQAGLPGCRLA